MTWCWCSFSLLNLKYLAFSAILLSLKMNGALLILQILTSVYKLSHSLLVLPFQLFLAGFSFFQPNSANKCSFGFLLLISAFVHAFSATFQLFSFQIFQLNSHFCDNFSFFLFKSANMWLLASILLCCC